MEPKPTLHPIAEQLFTFVNEAMTVVEAKARTQMIEATVNDLHKAIAEFEQAQLAKPEQVGEAVVEEKPKKRPRSKQV